MFILFYSTSNVFKAEEILNNAGIDCQVVPTPASDRAYCGVCIKVKNDTNLELLGNLEYSTLED